MKDLSKMTPQERYDARNRKIITFKLNINTDADIFAWFEKQENKQGALKMLVRDQIKKEQRREQDG